MATAPHKPDPKHDDHKHDHKHRRDDDDGDERVKPVIEQHGQAAKDEVNPNEGMITTQEEQLRRSAEIQEVGVEDWKIKQSQAPANQPVQHKNSTRQVAGISPGSVEDPGRE